MIHPKIPHEIRENKSQVYPQQVIFVDTETTQHYLSCGTTEHRLKLGHAQYRTYGVTGRARDIDFWEAETFWDFVAKRAMSGRRLYVIAHNSDYDMRILKCFTHLEAMGYYIHTYIWDVGRFIVIFGTNPPKESCSKDQRKSGPQKHQKKIILLDTLNWFKMSLAQLGETIGEAKAEIDFEGCSDAELLAYCRQDVTVLRKAFEHYITFLKDRDMGNFGFTIAKQSFNAFRHRFMNHTITVHNDPAATALERQAYYGGRTECFFLGAAPKEKYYKLDINSQYPTVMRENDFPTRLAAVRKILSPAVMKKVRRDHLIIADIETRIDRPILPVVYNDRLCFPIGHIKTTVCQPEIDLLEAYGYDYKIRSMAIYQKAPLFRCFIDYFYHERLRERANGNEQYQLFLKIIMNSLYGKFGQRSPDWQFTGLCEGERWSYKTITDIEGKGEYTIKVVNGHEYTYHGLKESWDAFPAIAAFVTSYARVGLWRMIERAGIENCFYCDTDSLFVNGEGYERLASCLDSKRLGALKLEEITDRMEIFNLKDYVFGGDCKIKGVRKNALRLDATHFITEQWEHLNGAIHKNRAEQVCTLVQPKVLSRQYKKGVLGDEGRVYPYYIFP